MSFIAALLLPEQVAVLGDEACLMLEGMRFCRKVLEVNPTTFFAASGLTDGTDAVFLMLKEEFGDRSVILPKLERMREKFEDRIGKILREPMELASGVPLTARNVNCVLAGSDATKSLYLVGLSMLRYTNGILADFDIQICRSPGENLVISPWNENKNVDLVHAFLNEHFHSSISVQREALRVTFKEIMERNLQEIYYISPMYDTLFIDRDGSTMEEAFCSRESWTRFFRYWIDQERKMKVLNEKEEKEMATLLDYDGWKKILTALRDSNEKLPSKDRG